MNWIIVYRETNEPVYWIDNATFVELAQQIPEQYQGGNFDVCPA